MTVSYEQLKSIALNKNMFGIKVNEILDNLKCIQCGRCNPPGLHMEAANGIQVCAKESWARDIAITVSHLDDIKELSELVEFLINS